MNYIQNGKWQLIEKADAKYLSVMGRTLKDSFRFNRYSTYRQEEDRECFYTLCPLFFASTAFVDTNAYSEIFCSAKCEIMF